MREGSRPRNYPFTAAVKVIVAETDTSCECPEFLIIDQCRVCGSGCIRKKYRCDAMRNRSAIIPLRTAANVKNREIHKKNLVEVASTVWRTTETRDLELGRLDGKFVVCQPKVRCDQSETSSKAHHK